jgi:serine/threonine protein kinase/tetratricopeptide (TPR) repeat protein
VPPPTTTRSGSPRITGALRRVRQRPSTLEVDAVQAEVQARLFRRTPDAPRLGRYRLLRPLGAGGLGVVFDAHDPDLDRTVAIKLMRQRDDLGDEELERFAREAAAMARVSHPSVVAVFDVGRYDRGDLAGGAADQEIPDAGVFIVMERVEGEDLHTWLRTTRSAAEILRVFRAAGQGLAAAHAVDIVHRDFKPQNVMVGAHGAKVLDFGLARLVGPGTDDALHGASLDDRSVDPLGDSLTRPGIVMGTPAYMAPEQHAGLTVSARADQYAFCVALAEALLGARLFGGSTMEALHEGKLAYQLPKSPAISGAVRAALVRGLKPDPNDRWPSMNELLEALGPRRRRRAWALGASLIVAAGIAGVSLRPASHTASLALATDLAVAPATVSERDRFARDDIREHDLVIRELIDEGRDQEVVALAESLRPARRDDPLLFAWTAYWACHGYMRLEDYSAAVGECEAAYDTAHDLGHTMLAAKSAMVAAECYARRRDPTAMLWQRHAVAMVERGDLEPYHAAYVLDGVGSVLLSFGQDPTAVQEKAIALREEAEGPDAPALVSQLHNYVRSLVNQDRPKDAEPVARRMMQIAEKLPQDRLEHVMAEHNLGDVLCLTGRMEEGLPLLDKAIERFETHFIEVHRGGLAIALKQRASCLAELHRWPEAIASERRALEIGRESPVRRHGIELHHLVNIARWHVAAGEPERAREAYEEALAVVDPDDAEPALRVQARQELAALDRG